MILFYHKKNSVAFAVYQPIATITIAISVAIVLIRNNTNNNDNNNYYLSHLVNELSVKRKH